MRTALLNILGSNAGAQLLVIASTPLLTRLYDRADFGVFGVATVAALLASTLLTCRLEQSLHVTTGPPAALYAACLGLVARLGLGLGLPVALGVGIALDPNALPVLVFACGLGATVASMLYLNRQGRFRALAATTLVTPVVFVVGAALAPDPPGPFNALLFWQAAGYASSAATGLWLNRAALRWQPLGELAANVRRSREDLVYLVPSTLLGIGSLNMSVAGAAWLFDERVAGLVVIAQRVARAPVSVLGNSLNEVLRAAIPARTGIGRTFRTVATLSATTGALMLACVWAVPPGAYAAVLGDGWQGLREVLVITVVGACFQLVGTSVASMLTAFRKRTDLAVNAALFGAGAVALTGAAALGWGPIGYLWLHTAGIATIYAAAFGQCLAVARREGGP